MFCLFLSVNISIASILLLISSKMADIRVEFDGTVFGLYEEPGRIVVTESTAGVSSLPILAHNSGMTPVVSRRERE